MTCQGASLLNFLQRPGAHLFMVLLSLSIETFLKLTWFSLVSSEDKQLLIIRNVNIKMYILRLVLRLVSVRKYYMLITLFA